VSRKTNEKLVAIAMRAECHCTQKQDKTSHLREAPTKRDSEPAKEHRRRPTRPLCKQKAKAALTQSCAGAKCIRTITRGCPTLSNTVSNQKATSIKQSLCLVMRCSVMLCSVMWCSVMRCSMMVSVSRVSCWSCLLRYDGHSSARQHH
jgi:hypothetical protein